MNAFSLISILVFLLYLQLGIFVYLKNRKSSVNIIFFALSLSFSIWAFGYIFVYSAQTPHQAWYWDNIASLGYCLFPVSMVTFIMYISEIVISRVWRKLITGALLAVGLFLHISILLGAWSSAEIVQGKYAWHFLHKPDNFFYILFYGYLTISAFLSFFFLLKWRKRINEKHAKTQYRIIFYSLTVFVLLGSLFDIILPAFNILHLPNMGHITALPWVVGIGFSIIRYQLLSNPSYLMAEYGIREIREIMIFIGNDHKIIKVNRFTAKLLEPEELNPQGKNLATFFDNDALLKGYLINAGKKRHVGPVGSTLVSASNEQIECSLHFLAIKDKFDDIQGFIIYGQDNREALNLQKEIIVRQQAEKNLRSISEVLEIRVQERTRELAHSYKELQVKMTERMQVEEQIKADIAEKEVLINEIHNRVKNNMNIIISLINAQDKKNTTPVASRKFKELAQRVKSLLLVHQNLYLSISYSDVDFASFLRTLADELLVFYKRESKVELKLDLSDVFLDIDYAIPLGIILNELISNSMQHGFTNYFLNKYKDKKHAVNIRYQYKNGYYELSVSDNGKGMPANFNISDLQTNGLPLTEILVNDQINGKMDVVSSDEGTVFKITFLASK